MGQIIEWFGLAVSWAWIVLSGMALAYAVLVAVVGAVQFLRTGAISVLDEMKDPYN